MTTIDKLDISVYNLYAMRTKMIEQINQQYRLDQAASIPSQLTVLDTYPKMTELDILLGIVPLHTPWAYFYPPPTFKDIRRSPFSYRVIPSFGNYDEQEKEEEKLEEIVCDSEEDKKIRKC